MATQDAEFPLADPVIVSYKDVINRQADLSAQIEKAYGYDGIGLIVVADVPQLPTIRKSILMNALKFAKLPDEVKDRYAHPDSHYSFGWSHGKEKLRRGRFDIHKGSFYNNPQYDHPIAINDPKAKEKIAMAPEVLSPNIWPTDVMPDLEYSFKSAGQLVVDVGAALAYHVDKYVIKVLGEKYTSRLEDVIRTTRTTKARLLHYFPIPSDGSREIDSWCGWHNDHSALTGLIPNMFMDVATETEVPSPDVNAGLYARTRHNQIVRVKIPPTALGYQIGECTQVFTGAVVRATPHAVRALRFPESAKLSRETFAVFMQPNYDFSLNPPTGVKHEDVSVGQYKPGMTFAEFGKATIQFYYGNSEGGYD